MGIDGNHIVEQLSEEAADDGLTDRLACGKGGILTHVTQVRGHQGQALRTELACRRGGQQQFDKFVIGAVQAATNDDMRWQLCRQGHLAFAIREMVYRHPRISAVKCRGKPLRLCFVFFESQ